jgi:hypothetical protein
LAAEAACFSFLRRDLCAPMVALQAQKPVTVMVHNTLACSRSTKHGRERHVIIPTGFEGTSSTTPRFQATTRTGHVHIPVSAPCTHESRPQQAQHMTRTGNTEPLLGGDAGHGYAAPSVTAR